MSWVGKGGLLTVCGGLAIIAIATSSQKQSPSTLSLIKDFHQWKKVNPKPIRIRTSFDTLCRIVMPGEIAAAQKKNPHLRRFITVYVNKVGEQAMAKGGTFPIGSIIVKEKMEDDHKTTVLSTVMIKRERGYNPTCGDWEFAAVNGNATKIDGEGKIESCIGCHKAQAKQDFVYRSYVGQKG